MQNKKKILIPGGTGFIGYHLCNFCIKKGWVVHSISKFKAKKKRRLNKVKYIYCDIRDKKKLRKKLDSYYDYIVNLSGYVDHSKNDNIKKIHFGGYKNLITNFSYNKPKKFLQIGSSIEYGKTRSPQKEKLLENINTNSIYGDAKLSSTLHLLNFSKKNNFPATVIRLYLVYGPNQDDNRIIPFVIKNSINGKNFNCSPGNQLRDFAYIDDVIEAIYKALVSKKSNGELINIGYGKPYKIKYLINLIVKLVGSGKPIFSKIKLRKDELLSLYPSISKSKKILKWEPKISLIKGIKKTIKFYQK